MAMGGKIAVKRILSELLSGAGIHGMLERYRFSDRAFVLMYHRVLDPAERQPCSVQPGMYVTTDTFRDQIGFLKERFEIVFFDDLVQKVLNGEKTGGICAITLDDGWRDNYTNAFPVLGSCRAPATIYLATGYVGTDRTFWPEEVGYYLDRGVADGAAAGGAPEPVVRFLGQIGGYRKCGRDVFLDRCVEILKKYSNAERDEVLGYFRGTAGSGPVPRLMLSWDEAREMLDSGWVRFGAHTVNHEILDRLPPTQAEAEISESRLEIERRLGCRVGSFAYPNGNRNGSIDKRVADSGFVAAVTTDRGFLDRNTPLMEVPRIGVHEDVSSTIPMFRSRILFRKF